MDAFGPEAAFIARMTASTTHELRNALAVVKESAGLVDDLTVALQRGRPANPDKMLGATRRIEGQVARAADLLTSLSRMAHGLDHVEERIDLVQHARHVVFLCQRFARLKRSRLELTAEGPAPAVRGNALHVTMLLALAIDCCLEQLPEEGVVQLRIPGSDTSASIALTGSAAGGGPVPPPDSAASWRQLTALAERLGVTVAAATPGFGFRLEFPPDDTAG
jgi:C4-dicarboxylate-specific signal transduction histidine kinase